MLSLMPIEISQTASGGAWSFNTERFTGVDLRQIIIKAAADDTTFDFSITDEKSNIVYVAEGNTGTLNDLLYLPMRGIYTIAVANSSVVDSVYTGRMMMEA